MRLVYGALSFCIFVIFILMNKRHSGLAVLRAQFNRDVCPDEYWRQNVKFKMVKDGLIQAACS